MHKVQAWLLGGALLLGSVVPVVGQNDRRDNQQGGYQDRSNQDRSNQDRSNQDRSNQDRGNQSGYNQGRNNQSRGYNQGRTNYYSGMNNQVRGGDYGRAVQEDEDRHHHDRGGIGPGKGALIGGAGGAALGAIFGGGLKGSLIGGAAGAGIGALGGKLAQRNDHRGEYRQ